MTKTIVITGSTDGIGLATAKQLAAQGHRLLLHGRDANKLAAVAEQLQAASTASISTHVADLAQLSLLPAFVNQLLATTKTIDVLINNAGVLKAATPMTSDGIDIRLAVNTLAPMFLAESLLPSISAGGRVVNVSSAAQQHVTLTSLSGASKLEDYPAYAQSKLALMMWSRHCSHTDAAADKVIVSVNPGSLLGTKMVKEGFGVPGADINIGADILTRAAVSDEFNTASGTYYDNDNKTFAAPHVDATDDALCAKLTGELRTLLDHILSGSA